MNPDVSLSEIKSLKQKRLFDQIPLELRSYNQFVCWNPPVSKAPLQITGWPASVTDPTTWATYEQATEASTRHGWGIGFVLKEDDPFCFIDLDGTRDTDEIELQKQIVQRFCTYSERSPSGNGLHLICKGCVPTGRRFKSIEIYSNARYMTMTGDVYQNIPIRDCQTEITSLIEFIGKDSKVSTIQFTTIETLSDQVLLDTAKNASNGQKFIDLWNGNFAQYYLKADGITGDQSRADFALVNILAFYTRNVEQIKRLFLQSALGQREKAKRSNYLVPMIAKALSDQFTPSIPGQFDDLIANLPKPIASAVSEPVVREPQFDELTKPDGWPILMDAALTGIAGGLVRTIEPHTESDRMAILLQFLTAIGCLFGRKVYFQVESSKHFPNLFCVIVGNTAKARKGTSWGWVRELVKLIDPVWFGSNVKHGLVSGEGLIYHVRDPQLEMIRVSESITNVPPRHKTVDHGVSDKRLLINEQEFSSVLSAGSRDGSTLSDHIRNSWDGNEILQTLAKNSPTKATNAHVSIIGHITRAELAKQLSSTDCFNGFGNRFLWACAMRAKLIPTCSEMEPTRLIEPFARQLREIIAIGDNYSGRLKFSESASKLWENIYRTLADEKPGLFGAMTARAEAQIVRLSLIYAILDRSPLIEVPHLEAAKAIWDYCEKSVELLFGNATGDTLADRILELIKENSIKGMSRTEISNSLNRNKTKQQIDQAIEVLLNSRLIRVEEISANGTRPDRRYFANRSNAT